MTTPLAYLNGSFLPQTQVSLAFHDAGFVFGATVTDLCRTFQHRPFRLADHVARFRRSCEAARIPQPVPDQRLHEIAQELIAHNATLLAAHDDLAVVLAATPGPIGYYAGQPGDPGDGPPTILLHTFPLPLGRYVRLFREGASLRIPSTRHVPPACVDPRIKHRSRLHWWLAQQEVRMLEPTSSALMLDVDGFVTETAAANFLIVRGRTVFSPPRDSILGGISLRVVEGAVRGAGNPLPRNPAAARRLPERGRGAADVHVLLRGWRTPNRRPRTPLAGPNLARTA